MSKSFSRCLRRSAIADSWACVVSTWSGCATWCSQAVPSLSSPSRVTRTLVPHPHQHRVLAVRPHFSTICSVCSEISGFAFQGARASFPTLICHWCLLFCNWIVQGVSLLVIWAASFCYSFVEMPYKFWEHYRSLIQLELILCECWEVRIHFPVIYFFSLLYFQHPGILFLFYFASKYHHVSGLVLYSKLIALAFKNISNNYRIDKHVIML